MDVVAIIWSTILTIFIIVLFLVASIMLNRGLKKRRVEVLYCSVARPHDCEPAEFEALCSEEVVNATEDVDQEPLINNCKWACDQINSRSDMCRFTPCVTYYKRDAFVKTCTNTIATN